MNSIESPQFDGTQTTPQAVLSNGNSLSQAHEAMPSMAAKSSPKSSGYGMPCSRCKTYYAANLTACPVCKSAERMSPTLQAGSVPDAAIHAAIHAPAGHAPAIDVAAIGIAAINIAEINEDEQVPDQDVVDQERERFLREFKAEILSSDLQIHATTTFRCSKEENHEGSFEAAAVCQACYDHLRERTDQLEAALLIDVKDATQVIYEAVWSDPSDPSKTYENAAQALVNELRRRAGISSVMGSFQPLQH